MTKFCDDLRDNLGPVHTLDDLFIFLFRNLGFVCLRFRRSSYDFGFWHSGGHFIKVVLPVMSVISVQETRYAHHRRSLIFKNQWH